MVNSILALVFALVYTAHMRTHNVAVRPSVLVTVKPDYSIYSRLLREENPALLE